MDWTNKNIHPTKVVSLGDEVEVVILDIDTDRRRISLGIKQCKANPWEAFATAHLKNETITGKIKSITDFGIFIGLQDGIDGLVHMSDISWQQTPEDAIRNYKKGDEVTATILGIDAERERISLGIKQLHSQPANITLKKGDLVTGTVLEVDEEGAVVSLNEESEGYIKTSEISRDKVSDARDVVKVGDSIEARILSQDKKTKRYNLSVKAKEISDEKEVLKDLTRKSDKVGNNTFGDLLKEKMDE